MLNHIFPSAHRKLHARRRPLRIDALDDRIAPAATSLYVITQDATPGFFGSVSTLKEYSPSGSLVRSIPVVPASVMGEQAHDVILTDNRVHVYNGTSDANLYFYNATTGMWNGNGQVGTSTQADRVGSGGLAQFGYDIFMTDMPGTESIGPTQGIVWFNVEDPQGVAVMRFAEDHAPIDVAAGLDGKLYSLDGDRVVRIYDPNPDQFPMFPQLGTLTLPAQVTVPNVGVVDMDYRAIAVDQAGKIYAAYWNGYLVRFTASGEPETSRRLPVSPGPNRQVHVENLVDLDFYSQPAPYDGTQLVVGSTNGVVAYAAATSLSAGHLFDAGTGPVYVTSAPALVEVAITPPLTNVTEGDPGTTTPVTFTVSLSRPSATRVNVSWTTTGGTATADADYDADSGMVTFAAGETSKTVTVDVIGDRDDELNESFHVRIFAPAGAPPGAVYVNSQVSVLIEDDDPPAIATPAEAVAAANAWDGNGDGNFESFIGTTGTLEPYRTTASFEKRAVIEFDTAGINLADSPVVTLDLYLEYPWYQSSTARIYGYAGNGTAESGDELRTDTLLGTMTGLTSATAWRRFTLDRAGLAGLMGQSNFLGIVIVADTPTFFDVRGTGSAHSPAVNLWNSTPPTLPILNV